MNKKIIAFAISGIFLLAIVNSGLSARNNAGNLSIINENKKKDNSDNEIKKDDIITNIYLTEEEINDFRNKLIDIINTNTINSKEKIEDVFEILSEYNILPQELNVENLTKILDRNNKANNYNSLEGPGLNFGKTYTTLGPHFVLYISFAGKANNFNLGIKFGEGNISNVTDFLNISDPTIKELMQNISIYYYWAFSSALLLFGGPLGLYLSVGTIPNHDKKYCFAGPFLGVYCGFIGTGIYIYKKGGAFEKPLMDIFLGFCPVLSIVQHIESGEL
jgi:hypothetical protein